MSSLIFPVRLVELGFPSSENLGLPMQTVQSVMTSLRTLFYAAIKQLLRGRSILSSVLSFWIRPQRLGGPKSSVVDISQASPRRTLQDFIKEAESVLLEPLDHNGLKELVSGLKSQFRIGLRSNPYCMLPSFNHALPSGAERGEYLALDVGGSNLRVAMVGLCGTDEEEAERRKILCMRSFKIGPHVKQLEGRAFFDWMAEKILETISSDINREHSPENPIPMSMAWSFPVE
jgi:hexokinase